MDNKTQSEFDKLINSIDKDKESEKDNENKKKKKKKNKKNKISADQIEDGAKRVSFKSNLVSPPSYFDSTITQP